MRAQLPASHTHGAGQTIGVYRAWELVMVSWGGSDRGPVACVQVARLAGEKNDGPLPILRIE